MNLYQRFRSFSDTLLDVPTTDPDDSRRRKLLNVILAGLFIIAVVALIVTVVLIASGDSVQENIALIWKLLAMLTGTFVVYYINRKISGFIASAIFLVFLLVIISISDTPKDLIDGRSLLYFMIPVAMASMLMRPIFSFVFAFLSAINLFILGQTIGVAPNILAIFGYFLLALVSWLSSRSLEQALHDLREINRELDLRVEDRTRELSEALMRELVEAGKTQAILQGIADGVLVFDENEKVIVANPAMSTLTGIPPSVWKGMSAQALCQNKAIAREGRGRLLTLLTSPADNAHTLRIDWEEKTLSINAAPVTNGMGSSFGTVAVFRDFTREAEIERMKNSFVAMVSHELRTPLNAVLAYAEMLRDAVFGPLNEKQFGASNRIYINSQRLLNIVSDLLDQAQIEAGRLKIQLQKFQTAELIDNLHSVMEKPAQDKGLELTAEIGPEVPPALFGDIHRIQQILVNLVNNAVKFTDKGRISVRIFCPDEKNWAIAVQDTGPGIPLGDQPYVFEAFRQVESITTREHGGIGLGLSIVKRLAILMGGDIALESAVGKGSTFTVTLPLEPSQEK